MDFDSRLQLTVGHGLALLLESVSIPQLLCLSALGHNDLLHLILIHIPKIC